MKKKIIYLVVAFYFTVPPLFAQDYLLTSPDSTIVIHLNNSAHLTYDVSYKGKKIVYDSPLGFEFKNEPAMQSGFLITDTRENSIDETWEPVVKSKHAIVGNHCNELILELREKEELQRIMTVYFRAYNDGVAFRYQLYRSQVPGNRYITKELTGFQFKRDAKAWVAEYKPLYHSSQESEFWPRNLSYVSEKTVAGLPFLIETNDHVFAAVTEAAIDNYPGFYIGASVSEDTSMALLVTKLAPLPGEADTGVKARFADKLFTPWRVIMLADKPGRLIESEIVQNLNKPCAIKDPSSDQAGYQCMGSLVEWRC